jgi:hypothetical protein
MDGLNVQITHEEENTRNSMQQREEPDLIRGRSVMWGYMHIYIGVYACTRHTYTRTVLQTTRIHKTYTESFSKCTLMYPMYIHQTLLVHFITPTELQFTVNRTYMSTNLSTTKCVSSTQTWD